MWGLTPTATNSQATLVYKLFVNTYPHPNGSRGMQQKGKPCPMHDVTFCNGNTCDFATGVCMCPPHLKGQDCSIPSIELIAGPTLAGAPLNPNVIAYYYMHIATSSHQHLVITLD